MQSLIRLTQIVHVLSDVITDWEVIVDSFEQIVVLLLTATTTNGNPTSSQPPLTSLAPNAPPKSQVPPTLPSSGIVLIHEELTSMDVDRIFECIERFKGYTVFFSDESLMRLMTSLVALSLNPLAASFASPLPAPPVTSAGNLLLAPSILWSDSPQECQLLSHQSIAMLLHRAFLLKAHLLVLLNSLQFPLSIFLLTLWMDLPIFSKL